MIKQLTFGALIVLVVCLSACRTTKELVTDSKNIAFETIHTDMLGGGGYEGIEESIILCNTQSEFDALKTRMNTINNSTQFTADVTIDFDSESVLAYFQPVRSSGGYGLSADSLIQKSNNGNIAYTMHYTLEIPKGSTISVLTQPFIFIKTRKLNGPVDFAVVER